MPSYTTGQVIKEMRMRKKWSIAKLQSYSTEQSEGYKDIQQALVRMENNGHSPYIGTVEPIMEALDIPMDQFFCPYLDGYDADLFTLRSEILNALDLAEDVGSTDALEDAESNLASLSKKLDMASAINRQFVLSCKAMVAAISGEDALKTIAMIREGLDCTYPGFDERSFEGEVLIFEEGNLLHTLALTYSKMGKSEEAINLLSNIAYGLGKLPEDDVEKEKKLPKVMYTLSRLMIETGLYGNALALCEQGSRVALSCDKGKYVPGFAYNKAYCLLRLGNGDGCGGVLRQAYFGYSLMNMKAQQEKVLEDASSIFGISFETYGTRGLSLVPAKKGVDSRLRSLNDVVPCGRIGDLIRNLRTQAGLTQKDLFQGVCSPGNYSKIESGEIQGNVYYLEHFMQRLGRDINLFLNTFLSAEAFEEKQMRDRLRMLLIAWKYDEAEEMMEALGKRKPFLRGVGKQTILDAKASILNERKGDCQEYLDMILEGLRITLPTFSERKIEFYNLSQNEVRLINKLAIYYAETGNLPAALHIYAAMRLSMDNSYLDESEKMKTYVTILYNYSKYLGLSGRHDEAYEIARTGEAIAIREGQIRLLPGFAMNIACSLLALGQKEESVPHFSQAYYGSALVNKVENQAAAGGYVREHLQIGFE
ncbi:MAG: hypothetical protein FWB97_07360 [Oscillospiraceae bacterium]|nr:hypothetical protein [Oscillospiraceae bacterium]